MGDAVFARNLLGAGEPPSAQRLRGAQQSLGAWKPNGYGRSVSTLVLRYSKLDVQIEKTRQV